jgi:CBS domain containing-hemolysin-like protein
VLSIGISFLCSISEAAFYSLPLSHIETLRQKGITSGKRLAHIKNNMDDYIASILIVNTLANTFGVIWAGKSIVALFGSKSTFDFYFPFVMTALILILAEMIPKTIGVTYAKEVAPVLSWVFIRITLVFKYMGLIALTRFITNCFSKKRSEEISANDIHSLASLGAKAGTIDEQQEKVIKNILNLDTLSVRSIMTPRSVMITMSSKASVDEAIRNNWTYSRIPITGKNPEEIIGVVLRKDIFQAAHGHQGAQLLETFKREILFIPENIKADQLLSQLLKEKAHIAMVVDEYGGIAGLVSLEDVLEEVLGREIVDESDTSEDLQLKAKLESKNLRILEHQKLSPEASS